MSSYEDLPYQTLCLKLLVDTTDNNKVLCGFTIPDDDGEDEQAVIIGGKEEVAQMILHLVQLIDLAKEVEEDLIKGADPDKVIEETALRLQAPFN